MHFWSSCASPGGLLWWGRRGFTRWPESPNVRFEGPNTSNHRNSTKRRPERLKFNVKNPRERKQRATFWAGQHTTQVLDRSSIRTPNGKVVDGRRPRSDGKQLGRAEARRLQCVKSHAESSTQTEEEGKEGGRCTTRFSATSTLRRGRCGRLLKSEKQRGSQWYLRLGSIVPSVWCWTSSRRGR